MADASTADTPVDLSVPNRQVDLLLCLLKRVGHASGDGATVLDFGCGAGGSVEVLTERGYDAHGCDIVKSWTDHPRLRLIDQDPYRLPYEDDSFDAVMSEVVFEHVQDHDATFAELARVMRPGAAGVHTFPPRWALREAHIYVPFAGGIGSRAWLRAWAATGIRNEFQQDMSVAETVEHNAAFLRDYTNYVSRRELLATGRRHFREVRLVEADLIRCLGGRAERVAPLAPLIGPLYSNLRIRALLLAGPR